MTTFVSGPMFEPATTEYWDSVSKKSGAHYNVFGVRNDALSMAALRSFFPDGKASDLNFVVFSTSGVHGMYTTIEEAEAMMSRGNKYEDGEDGTPSVTFLIVQPRIVCLRYGNALPENPEDIAFLKTLRATSWAAMAEIGKSGA